MKNLSKIVVLCFIASCQYSTVKNKHSVDVRKLKTISYQTVDEAIFQPHCYSCHGFSGGVSLQSYEDVTRHIERIQETISGEGPLLMPPAGRLPEDLIVLLDLWVEQGMPLEETPLFVEDLLDLREAILERQKK